MNFYVVSTFAYCDMNNAAFNIHVQILCGYIF